MVSMEYKYMYQRSFSTCFHVPPHLEISSQHTHTHTVFAMAIIGVAGGSGGIGRTIAEAIQARGKHEVKLLARKVTISLSISPFGSIRPELRDNTELTRQAQPVTREGNRSFHYPRGLF